MARLLPMNDTMNDPTPSPAPAMHDPLAGQPHQIVERDGVRYTLLGTAHVSRSSVDAVRAAVASGAYDSASGSVSDLSLIHI